MSTLVKLSRETLSVFIKTSKPEFPKCRCGAKKSAYGSSVVRQWNSVITLHCGSCGLCSDYNIFNLWPEAKKVFSQKSG